MKNFETIITKVKEQKSSIGTLNEKTLHAVIKHYLEPDSSKHEIPVHGYVADIVKGQNIYEIQLRNFNLLRNKLKTFLEEYYVTIVYPLSAIKYINYLNKDGKITKTRKSPQSKQPLDCAPELYRIKPLLLHPSLKIKLLLIEANEYRYDQKPKYNETNKIDQIPLKLIKEIDLTNPKDYLNLLPPSLIEPFTTKDLKKEARIRLKTAQIACNILVHLGVITKVGTDNRLYLYKKVNP